MNMKRAQGGNSAATLVAVITLIVIVYVLFLPPSERQDLLGDSGSNGNSNNDNHDSSSSANETLLLVHPGTLEFIDVKEYDHDIPTFSLASKTTSAVLKKITSLSVSKSVFDKKIYSASFDADLANADNIVLSLNIKEGEGIISIKLNNDEIYSGNPKGTLTLQLDKANLKETNTIEFSVSSPGIKFWATNQYIVENLQIAADVTDVSGLESSGSFVVTSTEKDNLETSYARFFVDCLSTDIGKIDVLINEHNIYSSTVDCGSYQKIEFSPTYLLSGQNEIKFKTNIGSYLLDNMMVKTSLKDIVYPTYYFKITNDQFDDINHNRRNVTLKIDFVDDVEYKKGNIYLNGHITYLDQREINYTKNVDPFLKEGDNAFEIRPKTKLDILTLSVKMN
jgi:hypothetical protein